MYHALKLIKTVYSGLTAGRLAAFSQYLLIVLGAPHQIYKVWNNGSADDLSVVYWSIALASNIFWMIHGYQRRDYALVVPQPPAIILTSITLGLCFYY